MLQANARKQIIQIDNLWPLLFQQLVNDQATYERVGKHCLY